MLYFKFQSEQQVRYIADDSGYHGAVAVTTSDQDHVHTTNFALGERGVELNSQVGSVFRVTYFLRKKGTLTRSLCCPSVCLSVCQEISTLT